MTAATFIVIAALGALTRALIAHHLNDSTGFAWGTLVVNVSGSFALGLLSSRGPLVTTVLGTGLLGAYTTFSSFARDSLAMFEQKRFALGLTYIGATIALSVAAAGVAVAITT